MARGGVSGLRLPTDPEFQVFTHGCNQKTNITGSTDPVTTTGHTDSAGRRMISNIGLEDAAGVMWQWLQDNGYRYDVTASNISDAAAVATSTVTHAASPGGNQVYLKFDNNTPYLACNMANTSADAVVTFGTNQKMIIKHDANANTGYPIYFVYNSTNIYDRLVCNITNFGRDVYIPTNFNEVKLKIKHDASAASNGVVLYFDDGADNRLEATIPSSGNVTFDLCMIGDVKLRAGGSWASGSACGSRYRSAHSFRWYSISDIGGRFVSEPL